MSPLIVGGFGLAAFTFAMSTGPWSGDLDPRQIHHEYYGVVLLLAATLLHWPIVAWVGAGLCVDDGVQHLAQRVTGSTTWRFSLVDAVLLPLVWKIPGVPKIGVWFDKVLGRS